MGSLRPVASSADAAAELWPSRKRACIGLSPRRQSGRRPCRPGRGGSAAPMRGEREGPVDRCRASRLGCSARPASLRVARGNLPKPRTEAKQALRSVGSSATGTRTPRTCCRAVKGCLSSGSKRSPRSIIWSITGHLPLSISIGKQCARPLPALPGQSIVSRCRKRHARSSQKRLEGDGKRWPVFRKEHSRFRIVPIPANGAMRCRHACGALQLDLLRGRLRPLQARRRN